MYSVHEFPQESMMQVIESKPSFLSLETVMARVNRKTSYIYREMAKGKFPKRYPNGWIDADIDAYIAKVISENQNASNDNHSSAAA
jgi:predicted DNA-binding transcriptional regulator AlpA